MNRMIRLVTSVSLALGLTVGLAGIASAEGKDEQRKERGAKHLDKMFERFDANKDGKLTKSEVSERHWERLSKADSNGDGAVTKAELKAKFEEMKAKRGERGKDGKGKRHKDGRKGKEHRKGKAES